jgi:broad specificity phosphatase PhoE
MFNPNKYEQDMQILRHNKGLDDNAAGQNTPVPVGKKGYAYDRGVENVLYSLENQGRQNTGQYINQRSVDLGNQIQQLRSQYQNAIHATTDPAEQLRLQAEFNANPLLAEAGKLDEGQKDLDYAITRDQARFPLNFSDQSTRLVKDAMSSTNGVAGVFGKQVLLGAGQTSANTAGFIKNTFINLLGSEQMKAENAAKTIGDQSLTELSAYEGNAFSTQQPPLVLDPKVVTQIQAIGDNPNLSDEEKNKQATEILLAYPDAVKLNPLVGHQNLTYKSFAYTAGNTLGQILGIADQSLLMGGLLGDAAKAKEMASAVAPMYASTQNQLYESALARGDEHPLLSSHLDATIISLASMINPDIKVIKGMVGAETALGKTIAGIDETAWNKVLSENKPIYDRFIAGTQATAKQLGLAGLQYGVIVPTAQYVVHKNILNEDPNLGDALTDGLQQTLITMALPALAHGVWGGINATKVNPMQKGAIVEAGLHPKENIELIDQMVEKGQVTPDRAEQIKDVIRQSAHILEHTEAVKGDGSWMNEKEVQDLTYQMLRKKVLEGKLKGAPDPQKPAIEAKIAEIDKSIAELHTSEADKQKTELNNLLTSNLDRIREKIQPMESQVLEAIKRNEPEQIFQEIYDQASQTTKFEGRDVSTRPQAEETFGKALVDKAIELHNNKTESDEKAANDAPQAGNQGQVSAEKPQEGAAPESPQAGEPAASSFLQSRHADTIHDEQGIVSGPNNKELSAKGRRDANDLAKDVEGKGVTTVITSDLERSKETGQTVADKIGAKVENRPELNTWNIKDFDGLTDDEFKDVQKWFVENPDAKVYDGQIEKFKGKEVGESVNEYAGRVIPAMERVEKESGPETLLINHSNNMMLWNAYLKNGRQWNDQARADYLNAKKPEPATLTSQVADAAPGAAQTGAGSTPGEPGGAEPGGPEGGEGGAPPLSEENPFREPVEEIPTGIKRVIADSVRTEWSLPEVEFTPQMERDAKLVKGKQLVEDGTVKPVSVVRRVLEDGEKKGIYTPEEALAMQYYSHQLAEAERSLRADKAEADAVLKKDPDNTAAFYAQVTAEQRLGQLADEVELKSRADRTNSNSWSDLGDTMQIEADQSFSPINVTNTMRDNYGGKIPEDVQARLDKAFAERDAAIADMKAAQDRVAEMELQREAKKEEDKKGKGGKTVKEQKEALKKERTSLLDDLKKAIKKDSGNLGANPIPVHTLEAIGKLALSYVKEGVLTIQEITDNIYQDLKGIGAKVDRDQIRNYLIHYKPAEQHAATEKALKKAASGEVDILRLDSRRRTNPDAEMEFPKKTTPPVFLKDTEYIKANQRRINAEFRINQEKRKSYQSKESGLQKTLGWANRLMRLSILSGYHVLAKLGAAATIGSAAQKPIEEVMNGLWNTAFKKIGEKADTDMGMNVIALGRYYSHFLDIPQFLRDTRDIVKTGETQLGKELEKQHFDHVPGLDLPTDLHQVIKAPVKRAMFEYALTKILADQQSKGIDINHPLVMESARQRAFARAKYEVFMEDNAVSKKFGEWEAEWKDQGKIGAAKSFLLHFAFPVSKVPTNIARRLGLSVAGLPIGLAKAAKAYRAGIENLSTEEANAIGRSLTKGSIGIALWTAGFLGYKSLGGLYSKFDPNKQRKNEPLADEMKLAGEDIAKPWQHALPFEIMQMGATFRHIYEKTKTTTKSTPIAVAESTMGSTGAILEQIPIVETPVNIVTASQDPYQAKKLGDDVKRRFEPQLLVDLGILNPNTQKPATTTRPGTRGGSTR